MLPWLLVLSATVAAMGYPNGAPRSSCQSMHPRHGGALAQDDPSPYSVTTNAASIAPGGEVNVTISGHKFKGYILEARDVAGDKMVGHFSQVPDGATTRNCKNALRYSAVTQSDDFKRTSETMVWRAPKKMPSGTQIYFTATVLKNFDTFWQDVQSEHVLVTAKNN